MPQVNRYLCVFSTLSVRLSPSSLSCYFALSLFFLPSIKRHAWNEVLQTRWCRVDAVRRTDAAKGADTLFSVSWVQNDRCQTSLRALTYQTSCTYQSLVVSRHALVVLYNSFFEARCHHICSVSVSAKWACGPPGQSSDSDHSLRLKKTIRLQMLQNV